MCRVAWGGMEEIREVIVGGWERWVGGGKGGRGVCGLLVLEGLVGWWKGGKM